MVDKVVIGVTGRLKSGKSVVGQHLVEAYGFKIIKFAAPMKNMCKAFGLPEDMIEGDLKESKVANLGWKTPRYFMQTLGTEWGRKMIWEDLWVYAWKNMVVNCQCRLVIADDVRFMNEFATLRSMSGFKTAIIKVVRGEQSNVGVNLHESEKYVDLMQPDAVIFNNGTVEEAHEQVGKVCEKLFGWEPAVLASMKKND